MFRSLSTRFVPLLPSERGRDNSKYCFFVTTGPFLHAMAVRGSSRIRSRNSVGQPQTETNFAIGTRVGALATESGDWHHASRRHERAGRSSPERDACGRARADGPFRGRRDGRDQGGPAAPSPSPIANPRTSSSPDSRVWRRAFRSFPRKPRRSGVFRAPVIRSSWSILWTAPSRSSGEARSSPSTSH